MKSIVSIRSVAAAAVVLGAFAAASSAHARSDVQFSIGVGIPATPVYVQPQPVYTQPVYSQPVYGAPVYVAPAQPQRGPWGDRDRDGVPNAYDRWDNRNHHYNRHVRGPNGDADRDGVPNRYDRFPNNPYYR